MHRTRRIVGVAISFAMAASLMVMVAPAAQAAAGANVALLNPYCGATGVPFAAVPCPSGDPQIMSSRDGLTAKLTAIAYGGDDAMSAHTALFFIKQATAVGTEPWFLVGSDSTPAVPDGGFAANTVWPDPAPFLGNDTKYKAFEVDLNTQALPGGATSSVDVAVVICGEGTTSFDANGDFDTHDNNRSATGFIVPILDCPNQGAGYYTGFDVVGSVAVNNTKPVVELPDYPSTGYHGDAVPANFFEITAVTTPDAQEVAINLCEDPSPNFTSAQDPIQGTPGIFSFTWSGGATDCVVPGGGEFFMTGGPTVWKTSFGASGTPDFVLPPSTIEDNLRLEVSVDNDLTFFGTIDTAHATTANQYIRPHLAATAATTISAVWDYPDAPGNRDCFTGSSAATSTIDPWRLTDADGDGAEGLAVAPAPDAGLLDIDDSDNPVLKVCVKGPAGITFPHVGTQVAYEVLSGPGDIDADTPDYLEPNAFVCGPATPFCSGGFGYGGAVLNGGYARPGSIADLPLADPLGRGTSRVCARACQHSDLLDLALFAGVGSDHAQVNSVQAGTTVYRVCVDLNGNRGCEANELSTTATMTWTPAGRNHNHVWKTGTAGVDGHTGQSTVAAPAGSTVSLTGFLHDAGHNGVANKPVIWRVGLNAPGHFVSTDTMSNASGAATAVIGSSVLDAARTTPVFFCGDGDADGICDFTPAEIEINWGGVVASTSISSFSVSPEIGVFGTDFVISGTLLDGAAAAVSSATVAIQRRTLGSNDWTTIRDVVTNGTGAFSTTDVDLAYNSDYRAVFSGNVSYTGATSDTDRAWVRVGIAMNVSDPTVFAGQSVRISGRVLPAHPGDVVTLQVLDNGRGWKNIASARLSSSSTYAFSVRHSASKSLLFRVTYPTQGILNAWNVSRNMRVTWA